MRQLRPIWLAFAVALIAVFAAMGWITAAVLRLDAAEAESRRRAQLEENARLALWRMDSALAPLIAAEHARPVAAFRERGPAEKATKGRPYGDDVLLNDWFDAPPPPLPGETTAFARLYFQFESDGRLTTPHGHGGEKAETNPAGTDVARFTEIASADRLLGALPPAGGPGANTAVALGPEPSLPTPQQPAVYPNAQAEQGDQLAVQQVAAPNQSPAQQQVSAPQQPDRTQQSLRNRQEYAARAQNNTIQYQLQNGYNGNYAAIGPSGAPVASNSAPPVMHAIWCGPVNDELVLARRVALSSGGPEAAQGCWVDWPAVRAWLLKGSADLLPSARLEPVVDQAVEPGDARLLASLPVRLVLGDLSVTASSVASPLRLSLVVAWTCVLLASAAVAGLLRGVVSLSERRGAFVSAVTHELRTPLTTLRMYTEMLEGGMVVDEDQRRHYLGTLRAEADRLGHLVENVLAYSRLERRRDASADLVDSSLDDLLRRPVDRLTERARQAGMTLQVDIPNHVAAMRLRTNPTSLEQILFNLVDNACKYAAGSDDQTIHLSAAIAGDGVRLIVQDHGPGIAQGREGRMFKPFSKSVQEAANSAPGLGLGLALSKRLASAMGGSLALDVDCRDGARFILTLPAA